MGDWGQLIAAGLVGGVGSAVFGAVNTAFRERITRRRLLAQEMIERSTEFVTEVSLIILGAKLPPDHAEALGQQKHALNRKEMFLLGFSTSIVRRVHMEYGMESLEYRMVAELHQLFENTMHLTRSALAGDDLIVAPYLETAVEPIRSLAEGLLCEGARPIASLFPASRRFRRRAESMLEHHLATIGNLRPPDPRPAAPSA